METMRALVTVPALAAVGDAMWAIAAVLGLGVLLAVAPTLLVLLKLRERVDTASSGDPVGLVVVTATGPAYTRPDGVHVVPAASLGL